MKLPFSIFSDRRFWKGVYSISFVVFLLQAIAILNYPNTVGARIEDQIRTFAREAEYCFTQGEFDLEGFSGAAYLYQDGVLRRWNSADYLPPSFFISERDSLVYAEASKKYMVLYKVEHIKENAKINLVLLIPLFQESPRNSTIIRDEYNEDLFYLAGLGPDSFEGSSMGIAVFGEDLIRFSLDYERLQLPMWWRIIDSLFLLLILVGVLNEQGRPSSRKPFSELLKVGFFWLFSSLISALWLEFSFDVLMFTFFISGSSWLVYRKRQKHGSGMLENASILMKSIVILGVCAFFSFFLNNWIEIDPSSYLGLNLGLNKGSLINYLIFSSGMLFFILSLWVLHGQVKKKRALIVIGGALLLLAFVLSISQDSLVWAWFIPPAVTFLIFALASRLAEHAFLPVLLLIFVICSAFVTRDLSLGQRLSQFEDIILSINRPEDSRIQNDLKKADSSIYKDPLVLSTFKRTMGTFKAAEKKILRYHLKDFQGYYALGLSFFDHMGRNLQPDKSTLNLSYYQNEYFEDQPGLSNPNIMVINNSTGHVQEFSMLVKIAEEDKTLGWILVQGIKREGFSGGVGPVISSLEGLSFNYSYWPYSSFKISKEKGLLWDDWVESEALKSELADSISFHFDMMGSLSFDKEGLFLRAVVFDDTGYGLAFPFPGFFSIIGNMLILAIAFVSYFLLIYLIQFLGSFHPEVKWGLRTKMQLLYLLAIIIPLGIFSLVLFVSQSNTFEENLRAKDLLKAKNFYNLTKANFQDFLGGELSRRGFIQATKNQAEEDGLNISVYDQTGTMFYTDFPSLYKSHIFSSLIDPNLFFDQTGIDLNYRKIQKSKVKFGTVVFPLMSSNGSPYYYLFVPFFDNYKKIERERERLGVITLGLFALFSSLFIFIAFTLTKRWLLPLDILSGQLKQIRLTEDPKPIEWKEDDEIGEVVGAYNLMISKLIESREALSISKQDEAWKEMAKQVAHEIKNPLTPMRLRIQQVLSSLSKDKIGNRDLIRYLEDALRNIDLVNETAKSFQGFASLPEPKNRDIDFRQLLQQVISPFSAHPQAEMRFEVEGRDFAFNADPKILGGAFLNLILNGLQSVPSDRRPRLLVRLEKGEDQRVRISFHDNGTGVDEDLADKIFEAHYTTKKSGSGLGLQIVKRSIDVYKGEVLVGKSEMGGARFTVSFPPQKRN